MHDVDKLQTCFQYQRKDRQMQTSCVSTSINSCFTGEQINLLRWD